MTFVDGVQHDYWRVDAGRLARALRGLTAAADPGSVRELTSW